jgi:hypothetical protein
VLGELGTKNKTVIINPRLVALLGVPTDFPEKSLMASTSENSNVEAWRDLEALLASNGDADNKTYESTTKGRSTTPRSRKRKRSSNKETGGTALIGAFDPDELDEEAASLKRMRKSNPEVEFESDPELKSEFERFFMMYDDAYCMDSINDDSCITSVINDLF